MTTVLITGIGGSIGIDVARSLRRDPAIRILGVDGSVWGRRIAAPLCDATLEMPRADKDPRTYARALDRAIEAERVDFVFLNPDPELESIAKIDYLPPTAHALPPTRVIATSLDKSATVAAAGGSVEFPRTMELTIGEDPDEAFAALGSPLWLRATIGAAGRGSIAVETPEEARAWMKYWARRGKMHRWMLQEFLPGRNYNWTGLYLRGELGLTAAMERIRYFLSEPAVSGVSGQVALCATVHPDRFRSVSDRAVRAIDPRPHGLYSVDLREDASGVPRVTEINPRLAGRPWLYTNAGMNLPLATVRLMLGQDAGDAIGPTGLGIGLHLYRQLDVEPVVGYPEEA